MKTYNINLSALSGFRALLLLFFALGTHFHVLATTPPYADADSITQKKQSITDLYQKKRYAKANEAIELLLPLLKNGVDRSTFEFYQAYCNFYEKKYLVSANQFHIFVKQYPAFPQVEEATFMRGYSLAAENVDIRLDQTATYDAISCLERYIAIYPSGAYLEQALQALQDLRKRLMQKSFQAAWLYARLGYAHAATVALKNFQQAYPDSAYTEQVLRLLIKCYKKLVAKASDKEKKQEMIAYSDQFTQQLSQYLHDRKS